MNTHTEFATVDLILASSIETRAVDGFALSIIKLERQVRRIFCFLIYQHPNYSKEDAKMLRAILGKSRLMYFENFIKGISLVYGNDWKSQYGHSFNNDLDKLLIYQKERNKIFHGQTTHKNLNRNQLNERIQFIKSWCKTLEDIFEPKIGFNGFNRNSFQKSPKQVNLSNQDRYDSYKKFKELLSDISR